MNLQRILNSQQAGVWALQISRRLPLGMGLRFSKRVADWIATKKDLPLVRAIRLNRWVVSGCKWGTDELDAAVRANLRHIASSYFVLFHYLSQPELLQKQVVFSQALDDLIIQTRDSKVKVVVCGVHMSNFDLVLQSAAWRGLRALAISLPETSEYNQAVQWQHQFRRDSGLEILPASLATFRQAIRRLKAGDTVVTGIDRPITKPKLRPDFFGRPASLPVHHILIGLEAEAPLVLLAATQEQDGLYHIQSSEEIQLRRFADRDQAILWNASHVLEIAADFIRMKPDQWSIYYPVWPELIEKMP